MKIAVMPGSFDPFTLGHADILERACNLFDLVYVGVLENNKKVHLFTPDERVELISRVIADMGIKNAEVEKFDGMLVDFMKQKGACAAVRGVRSINDYTAELELADINAKLYDGAETVFLFAKPQLMCVSSSAAREIGTFGCDLTGFVPRSIHNDVEERINRHENE